MSVAKLNWYQIYANQNGEVPAGTMIKKAMKPDTLSSKKQFEYYQSLLSFLKEKGIPTNCWERANNRQKVNSWINAMWTIIHKNNFEKEWKEWFEKSKGG